MADSSTEAMPEMMSPSPGMSCPASTTTTSPSLRSEDGTSMMATDNERASGSPFSSYPRTRWAGVVVRVLRSASAWALPRPSATASARFANSTVAHRHTAMIQVKYTGSPAHSSGMNSWNTPRSVRNAAPTHTTNMTGLCRILAGLNFLNAAGRLLPSIAGNDALLLVRTSLMTSFAVAEDMLCHQTFCQRSQSKRREERQRGNNENDENEQANEQLVVGLHRAGGLRHDILLGQRAGQA